MARSRSRSRSETNIWPGFVDALATLLLSLVFLLVVFFLAQFFLTQALSDRDEALERLNAEIAELQSILSSERRANEDLRSNVSQLSAALSESTAERDRLSMQVRTLTERAEKAEEELGELRRISEAEQAELEARLAELAAREASLARLRDQAETARGKAETELSELRTLYFQQQDRLAEVEEKLVQRETRLAELDDELAQARNRLQATMGELESSQAKAEEQRQKAAERAAALSEEQRISEAARRQVHLLNLQIAALRKEIADIQGLLDEYERREAESKATIADLGRRLNKALAAQVEKLSRYRSEFFGRLREVLADQPGIRIVGDRFVFQSEVLFESGSANLGIGGRIQMTRLAETLVDISRKIPEDINWVLRIDGHTDRVPINTRQFPSNWELSAARAIAVAKFLIDQGLPPHRLAATGFGEYHPIEEGDSELARLRNRRIELKLTER